MKYSRTKFVPITTVTGEPPFTPEAHALSSLVLSAYEEVGPAVSPGAVDHILVVTEGEVTLRFAEHDRHLEREESLHLPADASYSLWNHTPWRSKILRAELTPGSVASPTKSKGPASALRPSRLVRKRTRGHSPRFYRSHSPTTRIQP